MHISSTLAEKGFLPIPLLKLWTLDTDAHIYELYTLKNTNTVIHSSELSVRNYFVPVIESKRDGAEVFPLEDMLSKKGTALRRGLTTRGSV